MVQDCSYSTAIGYDRLRGVLVAQQKVVPAERFADLVGGEGGRRDRFKSCSIYLFPYKNTLPTGSGVPAEPVVVLQASVFLYGEVA